MSERTPFILPIRVLWSIPGASEAHEAHLEGLHGAQARLGSDELAEAAVALAEVGAEVRIELLDGAGAAVAVGLARPLSVDLPRHTEVEIVALGNDPALLAQLAAALAPTPVRPPPLPVATPKAGPPPLPVDDVQEEIQPLAIQRPGVVIGIDLGTTNTCASYVVDGRAKIIPGRTGQSTIPSMITFDPDGTFHIGQRAADRQVLHPLRTVYGSKRLLGRTYRAELAAELQRHFAYPLGEAEGQRFGARIDDRTISMETIAARVLDEVRSTAEAHLKTTVDSAVITVPAYFTEVQREAVRRAAAQAKLTIFRIVNEPTAAAVAYGHKQQPASARVVVWDFGGGTFDFSIVDVSDGQLEVVATGGDNFVGGSDFDDLLASHLLTEFQKSGAAFEPDPQQIARLREAAEHAKRTLSVETEVTVSIPELTRQPRRDLTVEITRDQFDAITRPLIERTVAIATEVMGTAGVAPADVDDVLLVGGTTRIPAVEKAVAELFQRRPSKRINPDEAVALGAALLADEIGSGTAPALLDILPMTVGRGLPQRRFEPLVARYTRVPVVREVVLPADVLGSVYVPLFQGDSPDASQNEYLCSIIVEDRSLWDGGRIILRLSFDEHCVMAVSAIHARTKRALPVTLDRSRPVHDVVRDLGAFEGAPQEAWRPPVSTLGKVLGKLFKLFGRG